ncbi:MAG: hypothetical protein WC763_06615 [Candidatus Paceibacterota bacterium]|jgi:hypothetical protein
MSDIDERTLLEAARKLTDPQTPASDIPTLNRNATVASLHIWDRLAREPAYEDRLANQLLGAAVSRNPQTRTLAFEAAEQLKRVAYNNPDTDDKKVAYLLDVIDEVLEDEQSQLLEGTTPSRSAIIHDGNKKPPSSSVDFTNTLLIGTSLTTGLAAGWSLIRNGKKMDLVNSVMLVLVLALSAVVFGLSTASALKAKKKKSATASAPPYSIVSGRKRRVAPSSPSSLPSSSSSSSK